MLDPGTSLRLEITILTPQTHRQVLVVAMPLDYTRTTALSNSMKLSHARGATQDGRVMVERNPQLSLATRGEDWASQGQPKGKAEIPVVPL